MICFSPFSILTICNNRMMQPGQYLRIIWKLLSGQVPASLYWIDFNLTFDES